MRMREIGAIVVVAAGLLAPSTARAGDVVFCVGGEEDKGKAHAEAGGGKWTKHFDKALNWAAEAIKGSDKTVVVKIAGGDYGGEYAFPAFAAPKGTLRIQGGWDGAFTKRDPFHTPSKFISTPSRGGPMFSLSPKDEIGSFTLDGLLLDAAGSNAYDKKTNSLLKGQSKTDPLIRFINLKTNLLAVENCVFLNSAHRVFETLIHAQTDKCEVRLYNSIFLNCIIPVKLDSARDKIIPAKMIVDHCSFLINWAFNPDPDTSNPAALELGGKYAAKEIIVTDSLFYANFGGGIMNIEVAKTKVTIKNNDFCGNGLLHGQADPAAAALIAGRKQPVPANKIVDEEEDKTLGGNVTLAPGIPLSLGEPKSVDASKVKEEKTWDNEVRRLLGKPVEGGKVAIKDFAPRKEYDAANPPFPQVDEAKKYGASPDLVK